MLAGNGISTNILYHAIAKEFPVEAIILEAPVSRSSFLKKRVRKLGLWNVSGQVLFQLLIVPFLALFGKARKKEIIETNGLDASALPADKIKSVQSANDDECISLLQSLSPAVVVVNGTRIISKKVLHCVDSTFINMHAGITPKYRGVHGAYWALVNADKDNCGVTIHTVDEGIDTGDWIAQTHISPTPKDNFTTYPLLQTAAGIPLMIDAIRSITRGELKTNTGTGESKLWSHPTMWQYLSNKIKSGIK